MRMRVNKFLTNIFILPWTLKTPFRSLFNIEYDDGNMKWDDDLVMMIYHEVHVYTV